jgi:glucose-6-phosphate dehydrogenase assembly protein OpcA
MPESVETGSYPVQLADIEGQLSRLWGQSVRSGGSSSARTVVLTLVALCRDSASASAVSKSVAAVAADHPSRAIIVTSQPGEPDISASVSVSCQLLGHLDRRLCSEQIHIEARGMDFERIGSFVQPLVLPDVPLVLWLAGSGAPADPAFDRLAQVCDRVLLDMRTAREAAAVFDWVLGASQPGGPAVVDLAWVALAPHRLAFAQLFDPEPSRAFVPRIDSVTIRSNRPGDGARVSAEALLIGGWIVNRLGWGGFSFAREDSAGVHLTALGGRQLHLLFDAASPLSGVALGAGAEASFEANFDEERQEALLTSRVGAQTSETAARLTLHTADQVLCGALEFSEIDPLYARALASASAILAQIQT